MLTLRGRFVLVIVVMLSVCGFSFMSIAHSARQLPHNIQDFLEHNHHIK